MVHAHAAVVSATRLVPEVRSLAPRGRRARIAGIVVANVTAAILIMLFLGRATRQVVPAPTPPTRQNVPILTPQPVTKRRDVPDPLPKDEGPAFIRELRADPKRRPRA